MVKVSENLSHIRDKIIRDKIIRDKVIRDKIIRDHIYGQNSKTKKRT